MFFKSTVPSFCSGTQLSNSDSRNPPEFDCSAAARVARKFAYSFWGCPLCPRTHLHWTSCCETAVTACFHSSRFSMAPPFRFQPRAIHDATQEFIPSTMYFESLVNNPCLLYTSDAADDLLCVDLGARRTIKKKKK